MRHVADKVLAYAALALQGWGLSGDRPLRGPLYAQIGVCDPCNQRCVMCPYHPPERPAAEELDYFGDRLPGLMPVATFQRLVDDLARLGTRRIDLVGRGEPLLHPRCVEMMRYAKRRGMAVSVTSNASRLTADVAAELVSVGVDWFRVSLDAGRAETYPRVHVSESLESYHGIRGRVASLTATRRRAGRRSPHVTLSFTISAVNCGELVEMVQTVADVGADAAHFQHVIDPGGPTRLPLNDAEYATLRDDAIPAARSRARSLGVETNLGGFAATPPHGRGATQASVPCYVGSYFAVVLGNGAVMPCCQTRRPLGRLEEGGFARVWKSRAYRAFRRAARALPRESPELATCECDRCYFRPHNLSVDRVLHPLRAASEAPQSKGLIGPRQLLRMSRLDRPR